MSEEDFSFEMPFHQYEDEIPNYIRESLTGEFNLPRHESETILYEIEWSDGTKEIVEAHSVAIQGFSGTVFPTITFGRRYPEAPNKEPFSKIIPLIPNPHKMVIQITRMDQEFKDEEIPRS